MAKNGQKWPKMSQNHPKMTFFDFQSVYTQNDRNFALIMNLSVVFSNFFPNFFFQKKSLFFQKKIPKKFCHKNRKNNFLCVKPRRVQAPPPVLTPLFGPDPRSCTNISVAWTRGGRGYTHFERQKKIHFW